MGISEKAFLRGPLLPTGVRRMAGAGIVARSLHPPPPGRRARAAQILVPPPPRRPAAGAVRHKSLLPCTRARASWGARPCGTNPCSPGMTRARARHASGSVRHKILFAELNLLNLMIVRCQKWKPNSKAWFGEKTNPCTNPAIPSGLKVAKTAQNVQSHLDRRLL